MAAKKKAKSSAPVRPVKQTLTKSALLNHIAEKTELSRKQVNEVLAELEGAMLGSIHPNGAGQFVLPGLFKVTLRKIPARKAGTMIRNPSTGQMVPAAAKPASIRVKVRALSKLKKAANG